MSEDSEGFEPTTSWRLFEPESIPIVVMSPIPAAGSQIVWQVFPRDCDRTRLSRRGLINDVARRDEIFIDHLRTVATICAQHNLTLLGYRNRDQRADMEYDADAVIIVERRAGTNEVVFYRPRRYEPKWYDWPITPDDPPAVGASHGEQLAALWAWQKGRCAMCPLRAVELDHDHDTGLVRGWLCVGCNRKVTHRAGERFLRYVAEPPAARLGIVIRWRPAGRRRGFQVPPVEDLATSGR